MGWTIYNSLGEPLITQEQHDHTSADASGPMTDDEHDGYSLYDEISAPGAPAANKGRLYSVDRGGYTTLEWVDSAGALAQVTHPPAVQTVSAGSLSINHNTWTSTIYSAADAFDTDAMHDTVTNNSRITFNTAGIYLLIGLVSWNFSATGQRSLRFWKGGAASIRQITDDATAAVLGNDMEMSMLHSFAVGEYVELQVWHNRGSSLSIDNNNVFEAVWVAPTP